MRYVPKGPRGNSHLCLNLRDGGFGLYSDSNVIAGGLHRPHASRGNDSGHLSFTLICALFVVAVTHWCRISPTQTSEFKEPKGKRCEALEVSLFDGLAFA